MHLDSAASKEEASALPLRLAGGPFGTTQFTLNGGDSGDNQEHTYSMVTTSSILPKSTYPQFASDEAVHIDQPPAFDPPDGQYYAVAKSKDAAYQRLRRTIDLTNVTSSADLSFKLSHDTEEGYDFVFVEAHTVGQDDWTTLPDVNGNTSDDVGLSCDINWDTLHPFLAHYQTNTEKSQDPADADCTNTGTTARGTRPPATRGASRTGTSTSAPTRASRSRSRSPTPRTSHPRAWVCSSTRSR